MIEKIKKIYFEHKEGILYLFFGGCTTVINYVIYAAVFFLFATKAVTANAIAWVGAVIFAYITNKIWVFENKTETLKDTLKEIASFVSARIATLVMEEIILYICVDTLGWSSLIMKIFTNVLVVFANYFLSKFLVFKKK